MFGDGIIPSNVKAGYLARLVAKTARHYMDKGEEFPLDEIIQMYDTHGIPPEITAEVAKEVGLQIDMPDTFYSLVAESHSKAERKEELYYSQPGSLDFEAEVLAVFDGSIVLNRTVMANIPVEISWMDRTEAEQKYGFVLYQGGVPPGKEIRILKVGTDVEACGGTHVSNTGLIGPIKLLKTERIQDGVERLEYAAGEAAVERMQELDTLLRQSAEELKVSPEHLPETTARFFNEWKEYKKENARLKEELASARVSAMISEAVEVNGLRVIAKILPSADIEELVKVAGEFTKQPDVVALLASDQNGAKIVAAAVVLIWHRAAVRMPGRSMKLLR